MKLSHNVMQLGADVVESSLTLLDSDAFERLLV